MKENKRASIKDVAKLAGVSLGTVSRAINNSGSVSSELRGRVEQAVVMLGYTPNHAAQSLRRGSTAMLGYMFPDIGNSLYNRLFSRLEDEFYARGYISVLSNSGADLDREVDTIARFQDRGVDVMVVAPSNERSPHLIRAIDESTPPVIILDRDIDVDRDMIMFDHRRAISLCVEALVEQGHTRIGLVTWESQSRPARERRESFLESTRSQGLHCDDLIARATTSTASAHAPVTALLTAPDPPTALIAHGTNIAVSTLRAVEDQGLRVPEDLEVYCGGQNDFMRLYRPDLPYVHLDSEALITALHQAVARRIKDPRGAEPVTDLIGFTLSTGSAESAPKDPRLGSRRLLTR